MMKLLLVIVLLAAPDPDWSQWRGPNRNAISPDTGLLKQWPAGGPPLAWKAAGLGGGYSSVSVAGDRIYTLGDQGDACNLLALNAADGKVLWKTRVGAAGGHNKYPGPRSSPSIDGDLAFALGQQGDLVCVETATGKEKWRKHVEKDFGGRMISGWRWSESPLVDGDLVVVTPGGARGTVVALKKATGETAWQSSELTDPAMYSSLVPIEWGGVRQYLCLTGLSIAGIEAKTGKLLWRADRPGGERAVVATPVWRDGLLFVTSAYGVGCNGFKVTADGGRFKAEQIYAGKQLTNHHGGVILLGEHVYGLDDRGGLTCVELATGKVAWQDRSVGKGSIAYADGHFVVRGERAEGGVALVEATPTAYKEKGRFTQPDARGNQIWPHPVVIGGKLYLRDQDVLLCYDVKAK